MLIDLALIVLNLCWLAQARLRSCRLSSFQDNEGRIYNLGFTIVPHDQKFFDCIQAFAPRTGVPDVNDQDAEILADAYHRYSFLIGLAEPFDGFASTKLGMDAQDFPDLVDCRVFCDDDAARVMRNWTGFSQAVVYAYLYEEFVYIASCGLLAGEDEDGCKRAIAARHTAWFGRAGNSPATAAVAV